MPSIADDLPHDVILNICRFCDHWRDILTLRKVLYESSCSWGTYLMAATFASKVSTLFDAFFRQRDIWADLVSACVNPPNGPALCFLERPLYTYSAEDLQRMFIRWKTTELRFKTLSLLTEGTVRTLEMAYPLYAAWSILVPGGRWLITFTEDVAAAYYDLDCPTPMPSPIIPTQLSSEAHQTDVFLSGCDISGSSSYLSFQIAFSYNPREADKFVNVIQIWEFRVVYDEATGESRLVARQLKLFRLRFTGIRIVSLAGNYLLLKTDHMFHLNIRANEKLLLIDWSTVPEGQVAPVKLLLFNVSLNHSSRCFM